MAQASVSQFKIWLGVMGIASLLLTLAITVVKWLVLAALLVACMGLMYRNRNIVLSKEIFLIDFTDVLFFLSSVTAIFFFFSYMQFDVKVIYVFVAFLSMLFRKMVSRQPVLSELFD